MVLIGRTPPRGTLRERAYAYVKRLILDGRIRPGSRIEIEDVMARLGMSRQPVRDAVNRLAAEGFVKVIPQVGCVVPLVDFEDAREFLEVYSSFEGRIAASAAGRRTEKQLAALRRTSLQMAELLGEGRVPPTKIGPSFRDINRRLHGQIHSMVPSPTVQRVAESLLDRYDFYIGSSLWYGSAFFPERSHAEHEEIILAIEARDSARACAAMEAHILQSLARIVSAFGGAEEVR